MFVRIHGFVGFSVNQGYYLFAFPRGGAEMESTSLFFYRSELDNYKRVYNGSKAHLRVFFAFACMTFGACGVCRV